MSVYLRGNFIFTSPGEKAFLVSSNFVNYLELGQRGLTDHYLEAQIRNGDFVVSGEIYDKRGQFLCRIRENNLEDIGGKCKFRWLKAGYEVIHEERGMIFTLTMMPERPNVCILKGKFYDSEGNLIAEGNQEDFVIYKGPAVIGKSGNARGIVLA